MSYLALYRKYRSKSFKEVYGQDAIIKTLQNALNNNKIAHAYLFSGPRGTGKTSVARLFAKALNCENGLGKECNECDNCIEIAKGTHPDVIEIDAASNSGVDEVRNLIDKIKYSPIKGRYKVYIIDEVHMMSNSAFNALLKTLEEPPSYVVFILCTTEINKVLPTIVSRCQRYEFKKLSDDSLRNLLTSVMEKENVTFSNGVIDLLIELANGGARDALSILDQTISYSGNSITVEDIEKLFGLASRKDKVSILECVKNKDSIGLIKLFEDLEYRNVDLIRLVNEEISLLKDALIYKSTSKSENLYTKIVTDYFTSEKLLSLIQILIDLQKEFKFTSNPSLVTELYFLKMVQDDSTSSQKVIIKEIIKEKETKKEEKIEKDKKNINNDESLKVKKEEIFVNNEKNNNDLLDSFKVNEEKEKNNIDTIKENKPLKGIFETPFGKVSPSLGLSSGSNQYSLTIDDLINLSVISDRAAKKELVSRWPLLTSKIVDERSANFVPLLLSGKIYLLTDSILVLRYDKLTDAKIINTVDYQDYISELVSSIAGAKLEIYAIDPIMSADVITKYQNLAQIGKLPKPKDVTKVKLKKED